VAPRRPRAWTVVRRSALLLAALLLAAELAAAWVHLQRSPERGSALLWLGERAFALARRRRDDAEARAALGGVSHRQVEEAVFAPAGAAVLAELEGRYRAEFEALLATVRGRGARLVLFYAPSEAFSRSPARTFFAGLAREHGLPLVEASELADRPPEAVFLQPWDTHPSRCGHRLMAEALAPALEALRDHRAPPPPPGAGRTARLGDLPPGVDHILRTHPLAPFALRTNAQGLRMDREVPPAAEEQVVLLLGDSFTFGTPLPVEDTYAARLGRLLPGRLVANAGVGGYGIRDERALYAERWRRARADVVVLQVLDNDLTGLLWYTPPVRTGPAAPPRRGPTPAERALVDALRGSAAPR
jgi:lysophospholipase L1-like esterase